MFDLPLYKNVCLLVHLAIPPRSKFWWMYWGQRTQSRARSKVTSVPSCQPIPQTAMSLWSCLFEPHSQVQCLALQLELCAGCKRRHWLICSAFSLLRLRRMLEFLTCYTGNQRSHGLDIRSLSPALRTCIVWFTPQRWTRSKELRWSAEKKKSPKKLVSMGKNGHGLNHRVSVPLLLRDPSCQSKELLPLHSLVGFL